MVDIEKSTEAGKIKGCKVKNLEILQDFALINHIFCDKTGTLTKNQLIFRDMSISGQRFTYDKENPETLKKDNQTYETSIGEVVPNFWRCVNICHDVVQMNIKDKKGNSSLQLSGASQDEVTFLEMCRKVGYGEFVQRDSKNIKIIING